jgi:hypothetical protein
VKEIISDPPDGIQQLHRRGWWGCLIAELGLRAVLHENVFRRPLDKCCRNVCVADAFEEVGRQIDAQTFATRLGDPPMLGPAEIFAHLKRILRLDRLRLSASGAQDEFLLAATAQNLRKLAKLIPQPAPMPA